MPALRPLLETWRGDPGGTYQSWFLWPERLKNFRSIRQGLAQVVAEIDAGTFGTAYKGSSLETVVGSIAEQRQMFKGADHPWLWKPKLRIPDIYESPENQRAFARFLDTCLCSNTEAALVNAIRTLEKQQIKGVGPAAANLLYFLHPTIVAPFNAAIVNGYNAVMGAKVKLGRWDDYLLMRDGMRRLMDAYRDLLSNDYGAVAALLFDIGNERYAAPQQDTAAARAAWEADLARVRAEAVARDAADRARARAAEADRTHTEVQQWLRDLGRALGFDVWIAVNDGRRPCDGGMLGDGCLKALPEALASSAGAAAVEMIDVLWLDAGSDRVAAAFEVEHTTSIYSGIMRMLDLALGTATPEGVSTVRGHYLVAPDEREEDVRAQLVRPAFSRVADLDVRYLPYSALAEHRGAIARLGSGLKPIESIARRLR